MLALDPFTGEPLRYEPAGRRYRLSSVGTIDEETGERKAVTLAVE